MSVKAQAPAAGRQGRMSGNLAGMLAMMGAMSAFVVNDALVKVAATGMPTGQILFIRGGFAVVLLGIAALVFRALRPPRQLATSAFGWRIFGEVMATALFIWAFVHVPFAEAQTITQFAPIAVTAAAALFLKERVGWRRWLAALVGFAGILLIVKPGTESFSWYSIPLFASVLLVALRDLATRRIDPAIPTLLLALLSALGVGLFGLALEPVESWIAPEPLSVGLLAAAACLLACGYVMMTIAIRIGELSAVAPFRYTALISAIMLGYLVWGEVPDRIAVLGMAVVVAAGLYTFYRESKLGLLGPARGIATVSASERRAMAPAASATAAGTASQATKTSSTSVPGGMMPQRSDGRLEAKLRAGEFVLTAEMTPPDAASEGAVLDRFQPLQGLVDAINVTDGAGARAHMSAFAAAVIMARAGIEPILQFTVRDKNRLAIAGELIGAPALGIPSILCLHGDAIAKGDQPDAKAVEDIDSRGLMSLARQLRDEGKLPSGREIKPAPRLLIGAAETPKDPGPDFNVKGIEAKIAAGADFFQTQFVYDLAVLERYMARLREAGITERAFFIIGVGPLASAKSARWMRENLFGVSIPDHVIERLDRAQDQAAEGRRICCELIQGMRGIQGVAGAHLMSPVGIKSIALTLQELGGR